MYPVLFRLRVPSFLQGLFGEELILYSYGFLILVGIIMAWTYVRYRGSGLGLDLDKTAELFLYAFSGVFIGGKLFFFLEDPEKYLNDPSVMFKGMGSGFVFYGSFLFTIPLLIYYFHRAKLPVLPMFDILAVAGALVHGFGKIGCFLSGCCHGKVCRAHGGVVFTHPESSAFPLNTPLYPVQLYDAGIILLTAGLLMYCYRRKKFHGQLILLYSIIYGVGRVITEIFRGDEERGYVVSDLLSYGQVTGFMIVTGSLLLWLRWRKKAIILPGAASKHSEQR